MLRRNQQLRGNRAIAGYRCTKSFDKHHSCQNPDFVKEAAKKFSNENIQESRFQTILKSS